MSNFKFNTQFKRQVSRVAQELGLIENTSDRQKQNGTISYVDPVVSTTGTTVGYTLHESGYVRRFCVNNDRNTSTYLYRTAGHYQLNRQERIPVTNGRTADILRYSTERIPASPLEQLAILTVAVLNYRK
jgi:hypothetical protein